MIHHKSRGEEKLGDVYRSLWFVDSVVGDKERCACVVRIKTKANNAGGGVLTKYHDNYKDLPSRGPTKPGSGIIKNLSHAERNTPNAFKRLA